MAIFNSYVKLPDGIPNAWKTLQTTNQILVPLKKISWWIHKCSVVINKPVILYIHGTMGFIMFFKIIITVYSTIRRNAHHLPHSLHGVGWGGVGWGGVVNIPSATFPRPCTRCWCYAHMGWGGVGMLMFLRPRSLDLAQDVDATITWGGVGWDVNVPSATCGVGWGDANVHPTLHKTLMLHQWGGVGWGDDNAHSTLRKTLMLRPRWSNYHGLRWGGVGAFCSNLLGFCESCSF